MYVVENKKTKERYILFDYGVNVTKNKNEDMVIYAKEEDLGKDDLVIYIREHKEFDQKFELIGKEECYHG